MTFRMAAADGASALTARCAPNGVDRMNVKP